jgi:polysaccharide export outer membrane protein
MIATAEGFTETADSTVMIFRDEGGKRTGAQFDVDAIRSGKSKDPQIMEGDAVVVSDSTFKQTYQGVLRVLPLGGLFVTLL